MSVLFWGSGDSPVNYSNSNISWNAWNRHSTRGSYSAIISLPLTNVKWHSDPWPVTVTSLQISFWTKSISPACRNWGGLSESPIERVVPCKCRTGTLKNPAKCLWRWESDHRYNFFFSPPPHLCHHIYDWKTVACDVNHQSTKLISWPWYRTWLHRL